MKFKKNLFNVKPLLGLLLFLIGVIAPVLVILHPTPVKAATNFYYCAGYDYNDLGIDTDSSCGTNPNANNYTNWLLSGPGSGQIALNTSRFIGAGPGSSGNGYIDVNDCNPSQAVIANSDGSGKQTITVQGYQAAVNALTKEGYATTVTCTTTKPPPGPEPASDQVINAAAVFTGLGNNVNNGTDTSNTIGPITFKLCDSTDKTCQNPIQSITSDSQAINSGTMTLSGKFAGVQPGKYVICATEINAGCQTQTKVKDVILSVSFNGTAQAGALGNSNGTSQTPTCENNGGPLAWFLCKIYEAAADFTNFILQQLIQPLLRSDPISISPSDPTYQIWSNFRIYGNVVLVIALLVVVFGEVIGGGIVDAYTAKKMLPRILIAAILINLSIYVVALAIDVSNILGGGIGQLLTAPLGKAAEFQFSISGSQQVGFVTVAGGSLAAASAFLGGLTGAVGIVLGAASSALPLILLFVIMPAALSLLAAFITIILRQALIIFLVLVSPVAFALYCLPNTQQAFRRWWDLLWRALMVYPIIMVIFAVADILSVTLLKTGSSGYNGPLLAAPESFFAHGILIPIIAFAALFLPLLMIPFAFKMAGGALGKIHETLTNYHQRGQEALKGNVNDPNSLRNKVRTSFKNAFNARASDRLAALRRSTLIDQGFDNAGRPLHPGRNSSGLRRRLVTGQMFGLNITDLERKRKDQNELFDKEISGKVAIGGDTLERAFFARRWNNDDYNYNDYQGRTHTLRRGSYYSSYRDSDGTYKEFSPGDVSKSHSLYDGNESKIQTLIKYETGKVSNDQDFYGTDGRNQVIYDPSQIASRINPRTNPMGSFLGNLPTVMREAGLSANSASGASIGSFFATQTQRKELKHTRLSADGSGWRQDAPAFVQDWAENMGTYAASTSKTSPIKRLTSIYQELSGRDPATYTPTEVRTMNDLTSIARGLDYRLQAQNRTGQRQIANVDENGEPIPAGSQAPARVNDAIQEFIGLVTR